MIGKAIHEGAAHGSLWVELWYLFCSSCLSAFSVIITRDLGLTAITTARIIPARESLSWRRKKNRIQRQSWGHRQVKQKPAGQRLGRVGKQDIPACASGCRKTKSRSSGNGPLPRSTCFGGSDPWSPIPARTQL